MKTSNFVISFPDYVSSSDLNFFFNLCYVLSQYGFVFLFDRFFKFGSQISRKEYCSSTGLIVLHQNHGFLSPTKTENSASLVKKKHSLHLHISKF